MAPIKRHEALQQLSRDHHHGLLLCFKIRQGVKKEVDLERIRNYNTYFFKNYLTSHFREEEEHVFPLLGKDHPFIMKALEQHRELEAKFKEGNGNEEQLLALADALENHIRFEERELFNFIQEEATEEDLRKLKEVLNHENPNVDANWTDHYWEYEHRKQ